MPTTSNLTTAWRAPLLPALSQQPLQIYSLCAFAVRVVPTTITPTGEIVTFLGAGYPESSSSVNGNRLRVNSYTTTTRYPSVGARPELQVHGWIGNVPELHGG